MRRAVSEFRIRNASERDFAAAARIAAVCFEDSIRPFYEPEGTGVFFAYLREESFRERRAAGAVLLIAEREREAAGVAELRDGSHLAMLFVLPELRNCGVGRALLERIVREARRTGAAALTVLSAPGAAAVYRHWGFEETGAMECVSGVRFLPMRLRFGGRGR